MAEDRAVISRRLALQLGALASAALLSPIPSPARTIRRSITTKPAARPYPYAKPYQLTSQSQLSQDFFSTTEVLLAETDEVYPFVGANGAAAAVVRSGDTVSIVLPDSTVPSGYSFQALTLDPPPAYTNQQYNPEPTIRSLAVGNDGTGAAYLMVGWSVQPSPISKFPAGQLDTVFVWGRIDGARFTKLGEIDSWIDVSAFHWPYPVPNVPPRLVINSAGTLRFAVFLADDTFMTVLPANGTIEYRTMPEASNIQDGWVCELNGGYYTAAMDDANQVICADPSGNQFHPPRGSGAAVNFSAPGSIAGFGAVTADESVSGPTLGLVVYGPNSGQPGDSLAVFLLADGNSYYLPINASYSSLSSVVVLPSQPNWKIASVADGELQVALQLKPLDPNTYGISEAVPFQKNIDRVWVAQTPDPDARTFFVEQSDTSLALLVQSPATHSWTLTPIRRAADTVQDVSMWRTHLTVRDANGIAVPNVTLSATAESDIALWQNNSSSFIGPDQPASFTTNALGQIVIATPAIALHTPSMTFSGGGISPTVISPDGDVHAYLAGTGSLTSAGASTAQGMMDATTFAQAKVTDPDGTTRPLAPAIFGGATDSSSPSAAIATTINMAVTAGLAATDKSVSTKNLPSSALLDFTGGTPKYQQKFAGSTTRATRVENIWDDIESAADEVADAAKAAYDDAVSILNNAVGSAINSCEKVGLTTVTAAGGVVTSTVEITCLVADDVVTTISYVIADVKTALAAVTAILKTIGAELDDIIKWLRALLGGLIKDAWDAAVEVDALLGDLPKKFEAGVKPIAGRISDGMAYAKGKVDGVFDTLVTQLEGAGSNLNSVAQAPAGGGPFTGNSAADIIPKVFENPQAAWVFSKFTDEIVDISFVVPPNLEKQLAAVLEAIGTATLAAVNSAGTSVANTLVRFVDGDPTKIAQYTLGEFLTLFKDAFDLLASFSEAAFDALIDLLLGVANSIELTLNTPISSDLGYIGDVLSFLGIDVSLTLQRLLCLVVTFPAAVIVDLGDDAGSLFDSLAALAPGPAGGYGELDRLAAGPSPVADKILTITYAIAVLLSTLGAATGDAYQAQNEDPPAGLEILAVGASLIEQAISWPGVNGLADPAFQPYQNGILELDLPGSWSLWTWLGGYVPVLIECTAIVADKAFGDGSGKTDADTAQIRDTGYLVAGSALTLTSVLAAVDATTVPGQSAEQIVLAATEWLTTACAFLSNDQVAESTETISVWVKLALDTILGLTDASLVFLSGP